MFNSIKNKLIAATTAISFLGIIVFGFVFMKDMDMDQYSLNKCPFTVLGGEVCPIGITGFTEHNVSIYQFFSNALVSKNILGFLMLVLLCSVFWIISRKVLLSQEQFFAYLIKYHAKDRLFLLKSEKITEWLSLLESSPFSLIKA